MASDVVSAAGALVGVRRGSAGAVGTENGVWSNGDVNTTDGDAAVPLVLCESASEGCATSLVDERRVVTVGAEGVGIGFKTDIPSVPNTLFVVLRLLT